MRFPRIRPRYADVVATIALIFALGGTAYATTIITTGNIADGAATKPKLADSAVGTFKVLNNSLGLVDLKGADVTGTISFVLPASSCGMLALGVHGAVPGEVGVLSWTTTTPPKIMFGPMRVTSADHMEVQACNLNSGSPVTVTNAGVRIATFS